MVDQFLYCPCAQVWFFLLVPFFDYSSTETEDLWGYDQINPSVLSRVPSRPHQVLVLRHRETKIPGGSPNLRSSFSDNFIVPTWSPSSPANLVSADWHTSTIWGRVIFPLPLGSGLSCWVLPSSEHSLYLALLVDPSRLTFPIRPACATVLVTRSCSGSDDIFLPKISL